MSFTRCVLVNEHNGREYNSLDSSSPEPRAQSQFLVFRGKVAAAALDSEMGLARQDLYGMEASVRLEVGRRIADGVLGAKSFLDVGEGSL